MMKTLWLWSGVVGYWWIASAFLVAWVRTQHREHREPTLIFSGWGLLMVVLFGWRSTTAWIESALGVLAMLSNVWVFHLTVGFEGLIITGWQGDYGMVQDILFFRTPPKPDA
jgi:hypothetical protein